MAVARQLMTPEEYLAFERAAETKHEYYAGQIFDMAGTTRQHSLISSSIVSLLNTQLRGSPCETHGSDLRVAVDRTGLYTYADVLVVCGEPEFVDDQLDTVLNPTVIVEVLSDSTEKYDRGDKFRHYRRSESLQEYLLVSQSRALIERHARRENGEWLLTEASGLEDVLDLPSINCRLPLAEVYDRITFTEDNETHHEVR